MTDTFHLRIKKGYAAAVIEDLIKMDAVEAVEEEVFELSPAHKTALDKELEAVKNNPEYLRQWNAIKSRFKKG